MSTKRSESYYLVKSAGERETIVKAKNATQAKRKACKEWDISPSDPWCGLSAMTARKIKEENVS